MDKEKTIKKLLKDKLITEQVRYDVSTMISWNPEKIGSVLKELNITEDEFRECIQEYTSKRKIFFFCTLNAPFDDVKFRIGREVIKPNPRIIPNG